MNYIKKFQENNKLTVDGVIGQKTLLKMKEVFNLPSDEATAHFVGQVDHETGGFEFDRENLNYSSSALRRVFSKYFPTQDLADRYARQPEKIANRVYANRMGNGLESSGDGWKYRGRGSLQLTGKNNYTFFSKSINEPSVVSEPDSILPEYYWKVAVFFFQKNNLFRLTKVVDYNSIRKLTRRINGGYNGLQHRYDMTIKYYSLIKKKILTKEKQNEEQQSYNENASSTVPDSRDSGSNILVSEEKFTRQGVQGTARNKETKNSEGFLAKIIRWVLRQISGRHADPKRA